MLNYIYRKMKLKIYLIATIAFFGFVSIKAADIINQKDSLSSSAVPQTKGFGTRSLTNGQYQQSNGIYTIGAGVGVGNARTNLQTTGGQFKNVNNIVPGRHSSDLIELEGGKSSRAEVFYSQAPMYFGLGNGTPGDAVCYIEGSVFVNIMDGAKINQQGVTELTGDFIVVEPRLDEVYTTPGGVATPPPSSKYLFVLDGVTGDNTFTPPATPSIYKGVGFSGSSTASPSPSQGTIRFTGLWNVQRIEREDSNGNPIIFNLWDNDPMKFRTIANFPTIEVRKDGYEPLTGITAIPGGNEYTDQKLINGDPAHFMHTYDPFKMGYVSVGTNMAMAVNNLDLTDGQRFSVDAISSGLESKAVADAIGGHTIQVPTSMDYYKVNYGFVDVASLTGNGYSEVNMRLYDYDPDNTKQYPIADGDTYFMNTSTISNVFMNTGKTGTSYTATFLRGFTSPFETFYTDYQFYHLLTKPENGNMSEVDGPIVNPKKEMIPGAAYFFAMDPSKYQYEIITEKNEHGDAGWRARNRGGYNFSRFLRGYQFGPQAVKEFADNIYDYPQLYDDILGENYNLFTSKLAGAGANVADATQRFNTGNIEVDVYGSYDTSKTGGVTLLANPYLAPISLGGILWDADKTNYTSPSQTDLEEPYVVKINGEPINNLMAVHKMSPTALATANAGANLLIRSRYNVVSSAMVISKDDKYFFNVKYDAADLGTSAPTVADPLNRYLFPLQVFTVQAANTGKFTFKPQMKVNGLGMKSFKTVYGNEFTNSTGTEESGSPDTRSMSRAQAAETDKFILPDWFVIEAVAEKGDFTADRTAVRFFEKAVQTYDKQRDIIKNVSMIKAELDKQAGEIIPTDRNNALLRSAEASLKAANTVYTTSLDGTPLLSNNVDYASTKEIPLHYVAGEEEEKVTFSFMGIEGFDKLENCWLVDRYNDIRLKLTEGAQYSFLSKASTDEANRFLLVFDEDQKPEKPTNVSPITMYYSGSTLYITGLNNDDMGSIVQIFDLQGRLMGTTKVTSAPIMEYFKPVGLGTFVVKLTGKRNYNSKFANTENY